MVMDRLISWTPFGDSRTPWTTLFSYIFDYAIIIILAIVYAALDRLLTPFNQLFSLQDRSIMYPFAEKERVPIFEAILISCLFPAVVIAVYTLLIDGLFSHRKQPGRKVHTFKDRLWELNCGILGLLLAQGAAFCITGSLKNLIGRPRPDLIARCKPREGSVDAELAQLLKLSASTICTETDKHIMIDGFRSFPSGHSSASFAGLFYLSLYLSGKLHILDQRGEVWRTFIVAVPPVAAACIAASRIMDYRHHAFDVLFGSALGILCGWIAYRQYFPPLSHSWLKGRAYPMREWGVQMRSPTAAGDVRYNDYRSRVDRTADVMANDTDTEEMRYPPTNFPTRQAISSSYGLEPMRPRVPTMPMHAHSSSTHSSPGFENVAAASSVDESDYEHVRPSKPPRPNVNMDPHPGVNVLTKQIPDVTISHAPHHSLPANHFRDQVITNQSRRTGPMSDDEDDGNMTYSRPLTAGGARPI